MKHRISAYIGKELKKYGVIAVYLFGSRARNNAGTLSDYDIAVLLDKSISKNKYFRLRLALMPLFSKHFKHAMVDVIILNQSPILLAMNCIVESIILFDVDCNQRIAFETETTMHYLDRLPYERRHLQFLTASV